jgi:hypothetical protein
MKTLFGAITVAAVIAALATPAALGQQKTVKECRDEWRASTDATKGKEKDYVAKCRGEGATAAPAARPTGAAAKTAKECRDEWRASTDPNKGTQKDYVAKCRGEGTAAAPAATPAAAPPAAGGAKTARECRDEWRASTDPNKGTQKDYIAKCRGEGTAAAPSSTPAAAPPAAGGAKTARECRDEWRASTDPNKGTQKDYIAKCRGEGTAAAPASPAASPPAAGTTKTARACRDEWRASTDPAKGTEKDYVAKCRAGQTAAAPPPAAPAPEQKSAAPAPAAPAPAPSTHTPAPAPAPSAAAPARPAPATPAPAPAATAPTGANQYQEEARAKAHCPGDIVVWVNLNSHIYHFSGTANYGRHFSEKGGAYMCEKDAERESFRAAENEKRPQ